MTTIEFGNNSSDDAEATQNLDKLDGNLARVEALTQRLLAAMQQGRTVPAPLAGPSPDLFMQAGSAYVQEMMHNPAKIIEHQMSYWAKTVKHYVEASHVMAENPLAVPHDDSPKGPAVFQPNVGNTPIF